MEQFGNHGGAQQVLIDLVGDLVSRDIRVSLLLLSDGPVRDLCSQAGASVTLSPVQRLRDGRAMWRAIQTGRRMLRRDGASLVHVNSSTPLPVGALIAKTSRVPLTWQVYDPLSSSGAKRRAFALGVRLLGPAVVFASSLAASESLTKSFPTLNIVKVWPGVDLKQIRSAGDEQSVRARFGISSQYPLISTFARLTPYKAQLDVLRAILTVDDVQVCLAGGYVEDDYIKEIRSLASDPALEGRVHLTGFVSTDDRCALLRASDIVVHPALHEPFGLTIVEAMAAGVPVIAASSRGPAATLEGSHAGLTFAPGEVEVLRELIVMVLSDQNLSTSMRVAGPAEAERFSISHMTDLIVDRWRALLI